MADDAENKRLQEELALIKRIREQKKLEAQIEKQLNQLSKEGTRTADELSGIEQELLRNRKEQQKVSEDIAKAQAKIKKEIELADKPLQRWLAGTKQVEAAASRIPKVYRDLSNELVSYIPKISGAIDKTREFLKTISDPNASPDTIFGTISQKYYQNYANAARDTIRLQKELKDLQPSTMDVIFAKANTVGTGIDSNLAAKVQANIAEQTAAQDKLSDRITIQARTLGMSRAEAAKLADTLQVLNNLDIVDPKAQTDLLKTTTGFVNLQKLGILPSSITLEELSAQSKRFGIGTAADLAKVTDAYLAVNYLPGKFLAAQENASSTTSKFLDKNRQDLAKYAIAFTSSVASQTTDLTKLSASYISLAADIAAMGASTQTALKLTEVLMNSSGKFSQTADVEGTEFILARKYQRLNAEEKKAKIDEILSSQKYDNTPEDQELQKKDRADLTQAMESGNVLAIAQELKLYRKDSSAIMMDHIEALRPLVPKDKGISPIMIKSLGFDENDARVRDTLNDFFMAEKPEDQLKAKQQVQALYAKQAREDVKPGSAAQRQLEATTNLVGPGGAPKNMDPLVDAINYLSTEL